jgi:hypothetical protein
VAVRALRFAPTTIAPALAAIVLLAEAAAVLRLVVGVAMLSAVRRPGDEGRSS